MTDETSYDHIARARQSACEALARAQRAGLPETELVEIADNVIVSRFLVDVAAPELARGAERQATLDVDSPTPVCAQVQPKSSQLTTR